MKKHGFTVLEMIVALGVFAVVAVISVASLLSLTDAQKKSLAVQTTYDNLRFALESISKDIRTGDVFHCGTVTPLDEPRDCVAGESSLTYKSASGTGAEITYALVGGTIEKSVNGVFVGAVTATDITIGSLRFLVLGSPDGDDIQPRVTIIISGKSGVGRAATNFHMQTSVTQRLVQ